MLQASTYTVTVHFRVYILQDVIKKDATIVQLVIVQIIDSHFDKSNVIYEYKAMLRLLLTYSSILHILYVEMRILEIKMYNVLLHNNYF